MAKIASRKLDAMEDDEISYYVGVKGSPFAADCAVFGLSSRETSALRSRFPLSPSNADVVNGIMIKGVKKIKNYLECRYDRIAIIEIPKYQALYVIENLLYLGIYPFTKIEDVSSI